MSSRSKAKSPVRSSTSSKINGGKKRARNHNIHISNAQSEGIVNGTISLNPNPNSNASPVNTSKKTGAATERSGNVSAGDYDSLKSRQSNVTEISELDSPMSINSISMSQAQTHAHSIISKGLGLVSNSNSAQELSRNRSYILDRDTLVERGRILMLQGSLEYEKNFNMITTKHIEMLGGKQEFYHIFQRFFERLLEDDLLRKLFSDFAEAQKNPNFTPRTAKEYGELMGAFLLYQIDGDPTYRQLKTSKGMQSAHQRARYCPFRNKKHRGRNFSKTEVYSWLGQLEATLSELDLPLKVKEAIIHAFSVNISSVGPFIMD